MIDMAYVARKIQFVGTPETNESGVPRDEANTSGGHARQKKLSAAANSGRDAAMAREWFARLFMASTFRSLLF